MVAAQPADKQDSTAKLSCAPQGDHSAHSTWPAHPAGRESPAEAQAATPAPRALRPATQARHGGPKAPPALVRRGPLSRVCNQRVRNSSCSASRAHRKEPTARRRCALERTSVTRSWRERAGERTRLVGCGVSSTSADVGAECIVWLLGCPAPAQMLQQGARGLPAAWGGAALLMAARARLAARHLRPLAQLIKSSTTCFSQQQFAG